MFLKMIKLIAGVLLATAVVSADPVPKDGEYMISVYSVDGKCIEQFERQFFADRNCTFQWDRIEQTEGIYLVRIEGAGIKESVKTVLVH